jgi:hypothetical protein
MELERVRADFHHLVATATPAGLRRATNGTRWTNQQMLWHMAFGHLLVQRLLSLVRMLGRLPHPVSRGFAAVLNRGTRPFHLINYLWACGGALVFPGPRLTRWLDLTFIRLHRRLETDTEDSLSRRMSFPVDCGTVTGAGYRFGTMPVARWRRGNPRRGSARCSDEHVG